MLKFLFRIKEPLKKIVTLLVVLNLACSPGKEIPMEQMAKISFDIWKNGEIVITDSTDFQNIPDEQLLPYTQKEGFTAMDYKFTSKLYDTDPKKRGEFRAINDKVWMDEFIKAMSDTSLMNKYLKDTK